MYVADYMTPDPLTVFEREPVELIRRTLEGHGIHHLPVVDRSNELVGIITYRDTVTGKRANDRPLLAADIMTRDVVVVHPQTPLGDAINILSRERFGALPVIVGRHVVGMLSTHDMLRLLQDTLASRTAAASGASLRGPGAMKELRHVQRA